MEKEIRKQEGLKAKFQGIKGESERNLKVFKDLKVKRNLGLTFYLGEVPILE